MTPSTSAVDSAAMLGLGSALAGSLGLPAIDRAEWSALISRVVDAFTPEDNQ